MKRPEGFDEVPEEPREARPAAPGSRVPRARGEQVRESRVRPQTAPRDRGPRTQAARPERAPRPSADRTARAELRVAERARKRAEKREMRRFTRRSRRRRIAWLSAAAVVGALVALSLAAVYSPLLALREIRVEGARNVDAAQLEQALEDQLGTPLALLDEHRLEEKLGAFRLIQSYSTEILPPGTLIVHIVERTPIGVVASSDSFDVVDPAGVVLSSAPERPEGLPIIVLGAGGADSVAGRSVAEVLLAMPLELRAQVDEIRATTRDDVTLTLSGSVQRVQWGSAESSEHKARVLEALLTIHGDDGPGSYDVSALGSAVFRAD